mmetsp:Transcript_10479/g.18500  ORF Transcript_10479/g.18500 Transcript_10479/m.18500 type:complete len:205 (-) Transcript_10479:780-1394(-)
MESRAGSKGAPSASVVVDRDDPLEVSAASLYSSDTVTAKKRRGVWEALQASKRWFEEELEHYEILRQVEDMLGIRKVDLISWLGILLAISLVLNLGAKHWCSVVGVLYPAYGTIQMLTRVDEDGRGSVVRWMTYWVTFAFLDIVELTFGNMLLQVLPFYYPFKFGFLLWSQSPQMRGSLYIHSHVLAPFLKCHVAFPAPPVQSN